MLEQKQQIYGFDNFRLDVRNRQLLHDGTPVVLPAKAFDMLVVLIENSGRLITKDELFSRVWPDQIVEESNLTVQVSAIRRALDERKDNPRYIATVAGHGYRFIGELKSVEEEEEELVIERHSTSRFTIESENEVSKSIEISAAPVLLPAGKGANVIIVLTALVVAVVVLVFGVEKFVRHNQNQPKSALPFLTMKIARLTSTGKATDAAISPDGKYVVHVVAEGDQQSLWMRQVSTSSNVQINPPANVSYNGLTFSLSGDYLYYVAWDRKNPRTLYQMPALGGASRKLVTDIDSDATFSPDGKQLAFLRGYPPQGEFAVMVAHADGTGERKLVTHRIALGPLLGGPAWSPDGKIIAYPVNSSDSSGSYVILAQVRVVDGLEEPISSQQWRRIEHVAWLRDGSGLVFTARERDASLSQIWYCSYPEGQAHRITNDLRDYFRVSLTADAATLVTVESDRTSNIWITSRDDARRASQITYSKLDGVEGISWTPDGKVVYTSPAGGNLDLWMMEADGTGQKQLTADAGNNSRPSVSPDGSYIVFDSNRTGTSHVWRIDIDGSNARQLTNGDGELVPECSPDGQWVFYQLRFGAKGIWRVPIDGGDPEQIIDKSSAGVVAISPDGNWIATAHFEPNAIKTAIYPIKGGEPQKILDLFTSNVRWTPDGLALLYLYRKNPVNIFSQTVAGGPSKQLTDFKSDRIFFFALSRDGKQLALSRGKANKDVVLISNFKPQQ